MLTWYTKELCKRLNFEMCACPNWVPWKDSQYVQKTVRTPPHTLSGWDNNNPRCFIVYLRCSLSTGCLSDAKQRMSWRPNFSSSSDPRIFYLTSTLEVPTSWPTTRECVANRRIRSSPTSNETRGRLYRWFQNSKSGYKFLKRAISMRILYFHLPIR